MKASPTGPSTLLDQITPVILTRDEAANIGRTLGQLAWAKEVLVVDSYSTDGTPDIARGFANVRLLQRAFDEHATQWNFAVSHVRTGWFLALDADYYCPDALAAELSSLVIRDAVDGYVSGFRYAVNGRVLRASLYPSKIVLARAGHARFWQDGHTQRIEVDGETDSLQTSIIHDDRKDFRSFIARQKRYMAQEADKIRKSGWRSLSRTGRIRKLIVVAPPAVLIHTLLVRGLILDGRAGVRYGFERFVAELILSLELIRRR